MKTLLLCLFFEKDFANMATGPWTFFSFIPSSYSFNISSEGLDEGADAAPLTTLLLKLNRETRAFVTSSFCNVNCEKIYRKRMKV